MALREATLDTILAVIINTPLNFLVIAIAINYQWSATKTTTVLTVLFTIIAILRKTIIRLRFYSKYGF